MTNGPNRPDPFRLEIARQALRKARAMNASGSVWFGLSMPGVIGWSIALPAVLGALAGLWLDKNHPSGRSWTLALLAAGLVVGCWNAWNWVEKQSAAIAAEGEREND